MEGPFLAVANLGCPKENKGAVRVRTKQFDAAEYNNLALWSAQMSNTTGKVILDFPTVASGDSTPSQVRTHWGNSASFYPESVTRTGTGAYTITFPETFANEYGDSESVSFAWSKAVVRSTTVYGHCQTTESGRVITLQVFDAAAAAVDITAGTTIRVFAG